ncbi:hypothetical protein CULC0102_0518 [Corynebacterium ulcerans 0102]|nr:hypothetical protein CULC0102_0518 [Corynebacterium ulcerans 0102]BBJ71379.1 hypothetical protein CULC0211_05130 [Corynebacterium ulcerans]BDV25259.1 hypothetical protein CULTSU28_05070 [Corynebacterium ulcerans]
MVKVPASRTKYLRLSEAPCMSISVKCNACLVDLECEDDWTCPSCGTQWDSHAGDGDAGELIYMLYAYDPEYLSEIVESEVTDVDYAYLRGEETRDSWRCEWK